MFVSADSQATWDALLRCQTVVRTALRLVVRAAVLLRRNPVLSLVLQLGSPRLEVILSVIKNLSRLVAFLVSRTTITWCDGRVVQQRQKTATMLGQHDLLLGTLNDRRKLELISLFELLACLGLHDG